MGASNLAKVNASSVEGLHEAADDESSWASSRSVRAVMRGNRKRDTRPELALRRAVHRQGLRFRVCRRPIPEIAGTADLVFATARVAVFLDGCFWHGCPQHFGPPRTNASYWTPKIERNRRHDAMVNEALQSAGWTVIRVWEHEDAEMAADKIQLVVREGCRSRSSEVGPQTAVTRGAA